MRVVALMLAFALAGCGTKLGYSLGDMTYVHKPRCEKPVKEWVRPSIEGSSVPGYRRIGGSMGPRARYEYVEGHWHYYCND